MNACPLRSLTGEMRSDEVSPPHLRIFARRKLLYHLKFIPAALPGEHKHVFNRATKRAGDASRGDVTYQAAALLSHLFCSIIVRLDAHLSPPEELWVDENVAYLNANLGRPVPLFQESVSKTRSFEFLGCYRIVRWQLCEARGDDVRAFVQQLREHHPGLSEEHWATIVTRDWARVELEQVMNPILSGSKNRRYAIRYAWHVVAMAGVSHTLALA